MEEAEALSELPEQLPSELQERLQRRFDAWLTLTELQQNPLVHELYRRSEVRSYDLSLSSTRRLCVEFSIAGMPLGAVTP